MLPLAKRTTPSISRQYLRTTAAMTFSLILMVPPSVSSSMDSSLSPRT